MLCSLAELGWDSSEADRVALLDACADLSVGESLNDHYVDWQRIVLRADGSLGAEDFPAANADFHAANSPLAAGLPGCRLR